MYYSLVIPKFQYIFVLFVLVYHENSKRQVEISSYLFSRLSLPRVIDEIGYDSGERREAYGLRQFLFMIIFSFQEVRMIFFYKFYHDIKEFFSLFYQFIRLRF